MRGPLRRCGLVALVVSACGGCPRPPETTPEIVTVSTVEIRPCADVEASAGLPPGVVGVNCWVVSGGWMVERLEQEQALEAALDECEQED